MVELVLAGKGQFPLKEGEDVLTACSKLDKEMFILMGNYFKVHLWTAPTLNICIKFNSKPAILWIVIF